jgi:hypothetical protein
MNAPTKLFGSPSGEPNITTTRLKLQQKCEKPGHYLADPGAHGQLEPRLVEGALTARVQVLRYLYLTKETEEALAGLIHGIQTRKGFCEHIEDWG